MTTIKGISKSSFEEALEDAIRKSPIDPRSVGVIDFLFTYTISRFGKEKGGIAGLNQYFVELDLPF